MANKWKDIKRKIDELPADEGAKIRERSRREMAAEIDAYERQLGELRRARSLTQAQLAESLGVSQVQVSRIESQADLYLSTLARYIEAMGGELEITARFGDSEPAVKVPLRIGEVLSERQRPTDDEVPAAA